MKTPIQQLKERILRMQSHYKEGTEGYNCFEIASGFCDEYILNEKSLVKTAFDEGMLNSADYFNPSSGLQECENYYNQNFKQ